MYVKTTKVEKCVLEEIARSGPLYQTELSKRIGKKHQAIKDKGFSRRGVEVRLHKLQREKSLLKVVKEVRLPNGSTQTWYDLTMRGLVIVLGYGDAWNNIDGIAEHQADKLPLVFGKWNYFAKKGAKEQLIAALSRAVNDPIVAFYVGTWKQPLSDAKELFRDHARDSGLHVDDSLFEKQWFDVEEDAVRNRLTERALFSTIDLTSGWSLDYQLPFSLKTIMPAEDWVCIMIGDPDLKEYLDSSLKRFTERFEEHLFDIKLIRWQMTKNGVPTSGTS